MISVLWISDIKKILYLIHYKLADLFENWLVSVKEYFFFVDQIMESEIPDNFDFTITWKVGPQSLIFGLKNDLIDGQLFNLALNDGRQGKDK